MTKFDDYRRILTLYLRDRQKRLLRFYRAMHLMQNTVLSAQICISRPRVNVSWPYMLGYLKSTSQ